MNLFKIVLKESKKIVYLGILKLFLLLYADDIVIFSETEKDLLTE